MHISFLGEIRPVHVFVQEWKRSSFFQDSFEGSKFSLKVIFLTLFEWTKSYLNVMKPSYSACVGCTKAQ